jgi:hypothetical protein
VWSVAINMTGDPNDGPQPLRYTQGHWRLFHVVKSLTPHPRDFRSSLARRRIPPQAQRNGQFDPELLRQAAGVSCFETIEQARDAAIKFHAGSFIAEIVISDDSCAIEVARTGPVAGHHTVWASPGYFISHIVSVVPV